MSDVGNNKTPDDKETIPTISGDGSVSEPGSGPMERVGEQIGPYKLLEVLGEGGYGIVYLAEQQKPIKRRVALKVIKPGMDSKQVVARFEAERQTLALLDHPNIAHVFDAGATRAGRPYFVMEYVKGISLTNHCDQEKLNIEQRLELFLQVCEAVHYAHQKGIIHRDIKPSNILVSVEAGKALPKIIDFGVAKALTQPLTERTFFTEQGQLIGTPEYMSPEQAKMTDQVIDSRTDIYSLGVLLYVLLTGTLPFDRKSLQRAGFEEILRIIQEQNPPRPSTRINTLAKKEAAKLAQCRRIDLSNLRRELRGDLDWITFKTMEKDPARRYESAHALAADIQRYLNNEPVVACPPSVVYRLKKLTRRYRTQVIAAACALVVVLTVAVVTLVSMPDELDRRPDRGKTNSNPKVYPFKPKQPPYLESLPQQAIQPKPADGGSVGRVQYAKLSWTPGKDTISHHVYFGNEPNKLELLGKVKDESSIQSSKLGKHRTYYWRVDEEKSDGSMTQGSIWSFSIGYLVAWYTFDEANGGIISDSSGNDLRRCKPQRAFCQSETDHNKELQSGNPAPA